MDGARPNLPHLLASLVRAAEVDLESLARDRVLPHPMVGVGVDGAVIGVNVTILVGDGVSHRPALRRRVVRDPRARDPRARDQSQVAVQVTENGCG